MTFEDIDTRRFPCIRLAYDALKEGGTALAVLNVANDVSVDLFLKEKIRFIDIPKIIESSISSHSKVSTPTMEDVIDAQASTEAYINEYVNGLAL